MAELIPKFQDCSGLLGRTSLRRDLNYEVVGMDCITLFRPSRPDFIETIIVPGADAPERKLFRPSRPDFIETPQRFKAFKATASLFRPSRPDFIETSRRSPVWLPRR